MYYYYFLKGPPETPRDVTMAARAATKATVSWRVGLNGGSVQTFRVEYWQNDTLVKTNESVSEIDPPEDKLLKLNMSDLKPETDYKVVVISMNLFNNGSETRSGVEDFKTRGVCVHILCVVFPLNIHKTVLYIYT